MALPDTAPPHWTERYVGIPFADLGRDRTGCDCYGLVRLVYREELRIGLPDYLGYGSAEEQGEIAALLEGAQRLPMWVPVTGTPIAFDVAVFRRGRLQTHVGLVVRRGLMIHMVDEDCAKVEGFATGPWGKRLAGFWRHVDIVGPAR